MLVFEYLLKVVIIQLTCPKCKARLSCCRYMMAVEAETSSNCHLSFLVDIGHYSMTVLYQLVK